MDEEELKKFLKPKFQKNIYPDSVIMLRGTRDMVDEKVKKLTNEQLKKSHWMPVDMDRRWEQYVTNNAI